MKGDILSLPRFPGHASSGTLGDHIAADVCTAKYAASPRTNVVPAPNRTLGAIAEGKLCVVFRKNHVIYNWRHHPRNHIWACVLLGRECAGMHTEERGVVLSCSNLRMAFEPPVYAGFGAPRQYTLLYAENVIHLGGGLGIDL